MAARPATFALLLGLAVLCTVALSACESTQDQSARLARGASKFASAKGLAVGALNPYVKVLSTSVLHDTNGTAAVVGLRNTSKRTQVRMPISIAVTDAGGHMLFQNNAPGLEISLTTYPVLEAGQTGYWVDDQVTAAGTPSRVTARVGDPPAAAATPPSVPKIEIAQTTLRDDPVNGVEAVGTIVNHSKVLQPRLVIFCVARRGSTVVAAGRAIVPALAPAPTPKPVHFTIFFIGNPKGATLELSAPPTALR